MTMECEMLGALLSERRRGDLSPEQARSLDDHLAGCAQCREEAPGLDAVLSAVELPPISIAELEALRARRIAEGPPRLPRSHRWQVPAVLIAAAAAAVLTISIRPFPHHHAAAVSPAPVNASPALEAIPGAASQELFPEMTSDSTDDDQATLEDDVRSLEEPGLFGNIDG
jgi:hypothetical protein